jgi:hypothetical protein
MESNVDDVLFNSIIKLETGALAKLALWQNWRSGKTGALAKLALWQNWRSGKTGALANRRSGRWIKSQKRR